MVGNVLIHCHHNVEKDTAQHSSPGTSIMEENKLCVENMCTRHNFIDLPQFCYINLFFHDKDTSMC